MEYDKKLLYNIYRTDKNNELVGMLDTLQYPTTGDYIEFECDDDYALFIVDKVVRHYESSHDETCNVYITKLKK